MHLKRVYYSAYMSVNKDSRLPSLSSPALLREHRLYQADWLLRFYGFESSEILNETSPFLDKDLDPKTCWATRNLNIFPIEINSAEYEKLIRTPGIGTTSAKKIVKARRLSNLTIDDLKKFGVVLKRAKYFITANGKTPYKYKYTEEEIKKNILNENKTAKSRNASSDYEQLFLFDNNDKTTPQ
ncbi:biotin synthase [Candidatus Magnetoovum chiemensis]|nr:biotin synthase [Candidatus Magnetoovum chiemensis]